MKKSFKCPQCGFDIKKNVTECEVCGLILDKKTLPDTDTIQNDKQAQNKKAATLLKYMVIILACLWFIGIVKTGEGGWLKFFLFLFTAWVVLSIMNRSGKSTKEKKQPVTSTGPNQNKKFPPAPVDTTADINIKTQRIDLSLENLANLKNYESRMEVVGSENDIYVVDLKSLTCTCPDFKKRRFDFPVSDLRRICKHQSRAIIDSGILTDVTRDRLVWSIIKNSQEEGFLVYSIALKVTAEIENKKPLVFYIFVQPGKEWLIIMYERHSSFGQYLFSATERRWAFKENPFHTGYKIKGTTAVNRVLDQYNLEKISTGQDLLSEPFLDATVTPGRL